MPEGETLSLKECAEILGVHYMTAYRYVRLGMLPAVKEGAEWRVRRSDLEDFRADRSAPVGRNSAPWPERLRSRMVVGDEPGSWQVVEAALASGVSPREVYLEVLGPAMAAIGEQWAHGEASIAEEHRATAIATRIVGRLSARFHARGRHKGRVVIGTPPGERHALPPAMVADMLRGAGFEVLDLGVDLPVEAFVEAVVDAAPVVAIAVSVTNAALLPEAARLFAALHDAGDVPIVVGGAGVESEEQALRLGADGWAPDAVAAIDLVTAAATG